MLGKKLKEKQGRRRKCLHISLAKLFLQERNVVLENLPTFRVQILPHGAKFIRLPKMHFPVLFDGSFYG